MAFSRYGTGGGQGLLFGFIADTLQTRLPATQLLTGPETMGLIA